jgi:predicted nucleic-acid-binding Zn-ribbon protein
MSEQTLLEISCPNCLSNQIVTLWNSINVTLDPDLEKKFYDRDINQFTCEKCGYSAFVEKDLLYHNMEKKFMIQFLQDGSQDRVQAYINDMAELNEDLSKVVTVANINESYSLRVTNDMNQLMETVKIFNEGLSDIVIYIFKHSLKFEEMFPNVEEHSPLKVYFNMLSDKKIIFTVLDRQWKEFLFEVPYSLYETAYDQIANDRMIALNFTKWFFVSEENVLKLINGGSASG